MPNQFIYELTDTWNSGVTTYNGLKLNVADAASAADSKLINLQIGAVEKFTVDKAGKLVAAAGAAFAGAVAVTGNVAATGQLLANGSVAWTAATLDPSLKADKSTSYTRTEVDAKDALKFDKTGGPVSGSMSIGGTVEIGGSLRVSKGQAASYIYLDDVDHTGFSIHVNSNTFYVANQAVSDIYFRVDTSGAVWTKQFGDLNNRIEARAAAFAAERVARGGDTMSGNLGISKADAQLVLTYPGVKAWGVLADGSANLLFRDAGSGQIHLYFTNGGNIISQNYGSADGWQEARNHDVREIRSVSQGATVSNSGQNISYAPAGAFINGVSSGGSSLTYSYKYLQGYSIDRGWFTIAAQ